MKHAKVKLMHNTQAIVSKQLHLNIFKQYSYVVSYAIADDDWEGMITKLSALS